MWSLPSRRSCQPLNPGAYFLSPQGRLKHIYENMPKNAMDPTPKFDCHVSKNANKVTSLLSYRAFEHTQVKKRRTRRTSLSAMTFVLFCSLLMKIMFHVFHRCLSAILLWVCVWWDQSAAEAHLSVRRGFLPEQGQGARVGALYSTQVCLKRS